MNILPNDVARCTGAGCIHRNRCRRYYSHLESIAKEHNRVLYLDSRVCIESEWNDVDVVSMPFSELILEDGVT